MSKTTRVPQVTSRGRIVVTGASGFIGSRFAETARLEGWEVVTPSRKDLGDPEIFASEDVVMHCAAMAHFHRRASSEEELVEANVRLTQQLAMTAASCRVKRFIFLSSVKAVGESTDRRGPIGNESRCLPEDAYGRAKLAAERELTIVAETANLDICIVRPPLVYGPGVKGNFAKICRLVMAGWPMPVRSIQNKRSFIGLTNLVDFLLLCANHPVAKKQTFVICDGEDLSTLELVEQIAEANQRTARTVSFPIGWLEKSLAFFGRGDGVRRLRCSLEVDDSLTREMLGWRPVKSLRQELRETISSLK